MKTRTKKTVKTATGADEAKSTPSQVRSLEQSVATPPNLFILPKDLSSNARIVTIASSNSIKTSRLLVCPNKDCFEFTNVTQERASRSWLLAPETNDNSVDSTSASQGYVLRRPDLLVATPMDPLFVVLPMMLGSQDNQNSYLSCSDYIFNSELQDYQPLQQLLGQPAFARTLKRFESRMIAVSDSINLGDDEDAMYRLSVDKLAKVLISKATRMAKSGLPASLEQHFVQQLLQVPVDHVEPEVPAAAVALQTSSETVATSDASQDSVSSDTTISSTSTGITSISSTPDTTNAHSPEIVRLLRIRTAWDYMLRAYISPSLHTRLTAALKQTSVDFKPLYEHEERINGLKQKAQALRALSDNISRKRTFDDDEASAKADEKRRKKEEEEQRKKNMSQGVKKLMKADTSGMKKLSSFFTKGPAK